MSVGAFPVRVFATNSVNHPSLYVFFALAANPRSPSYSTTTLVSIAVAAALPAPVPPARKLQQGKWSGTPA